MPRPASAPKLRERDIAWAVGDLLELDGWRLLWCEPMSRRDLGKGFGEPGMPDLLALRYWNRGDPAQGYRPRVEGKVYDPLAEVLWIEFKRPGGRVSPKQAEWHRNERLRGALTVIMGQDCGASVDGFLAWYRKSGVMRRPI